MPQNTNGSGLDPTAAARQIFAMLPIRDHNPSRRTPYVTLTLIAINVAVYLLLTLPLDDRQLYVFYAEYGVTPLIADPQDYITSMFLHGGIMHLLGNMLFLWIFGDNMEDRLGHIPFLLFYLLSGIAGTLLHVAIDPMSQAPLVGASGAIAGVMGGYLLLYPRARIDVFFLILIFPVPAWIVLLAWFGLQLFNGAATFGTGDGVAYFAHIGGFIAGVLGTLIFLRLKGDKGWWKHTAGHPPHPEAKYKKLTASSIPTVRRRK